MSAITILYSGNKQKPSWVKCGECENALSEGNYFIPLFWLAMFDPASIKMCRDPDGESFLPWKNKVPYFSAKKEKCLDNFDKRIAVLKAFLPSSVSLIDRWRKYIVDNAGSLLSVDFTEVNFMDDGVRSDIHTIFDGFVKPSAPMISSIVALCGAEYDGETRELKTQNDVKPSYHLVGMNKVNDAFLE